VARDERTDGWAAVVDDLEDRPVAPGPPPAPAPFSAGLLLQGLAPPPAPPPQASLHPRSRRALWTVGVGLAALVLAVAFTRVTRPPPMAPKPRPDPRGGVPAPAPTPQPPEVTRAAPSLPMLTVLSEPSGAEVTVGAERLGRTPLVLPAPSGGGPVFVSVQRGTRRWAGEVRPGPGGHYAVRVALPP
jgi:hypothetical protein